MAAEANADFSGGARLIGNDNRVCLTAGTVPIIIPGVPPLRGGPRGPGSGPGPSPGGRGPFPPGGRGPFPFPGGQGRLTTDDAVDASDDAMVALVTPDMVPMVPMVRPPAPWEFVDFDEEPDAKRRRIGKQPPGPP